MAVPVHPRVIYHADMNAYYASVEELFYPEFRDVPMAICGDPESRRGIILAKNEKAKRFGVETAETIYQARRKCPHLVLRPARRRLYGEYCERANAIYIQYTDLLERASIDESYLDVTGSLHLFGGDAEALAHAIRERIHRDLGLTISVGVSYNKFFAKMASDLKKPNAVTVVTAENYRDLLWPLPIRRMLMVGKTAEQSLRDMGIETIGGLARCDMDTLRRRLGKLGEHLHANANGLDTTPVLPIEDAPGAQSIGNGITFRRDLLSREDIRTAAGALCDTVASRLRSEGVKCLSVQVTIKDADFAVITRQMRLGAPTWLACDLAGASMALIDAAWRIGRPIRLLTVTALKLVPHDEAVEQLSLLDAPKAQAGREKRERLAQAVDGIRRRFGAGSIKSASIIGNDLGIDDGFGPQEADPPGDDPPDAVP